MAISRNDIYGALFDRLRAELDVDIKFYSRKFLEAQDCPSQPALLCIATHETPHNEPGMPTVWSLHASVIIYTRVTASSTSNVSAEETILPLVDKVEAALERKASEAAGLADPSEHFVTTLGGLVVRAWINGTVEIYQGTAGDQSAAMIPIEMLVTA